MPLVQSVGRLLSAVGPVSTEVVECRWSVGRLLSAVGPVGRLLSAVGPVREVVECRWSVSAGPVSREVVDAVGPVSTEVVECRWSSQ